MQMPYDRQTWDLTAVLEAVEPGKWFARSPKGTIRIATDGRSNSFEASETGMGLPRHSAEKKTAATLQALVDCTTGKNLKTRTDEKLLTCLLIPGIALLPAAKERRVTSVSSPNSKISVNILYDGQTLRYEVFRNRTYILAPSPLTMTVDGRIWGFRCATGQNLAQQRKPDRTLCRSPQISLRMRQLSGSHARYPDYRVEVRAYDDGVAYRFVGTTDREGCGTGRDRL